MCLGNYSACAFLIPSFTVSTLSFVSHIIMLGVETENEASYVFEWNRSWLSSIADARAQKEGQTDSFSRICSIHA